MSEKLIAAIETALAQGHRVQLKQLDGGEPRPLSPGLPAVGAVPGGPGGGRAEDLRDLPAAQVRRHGPGDREAGRGWEVQKLGGGVPEGKRPCKFH